ncbi:hypothetical protein AJ80_05456 [Polytolypa hystricis UAMH7299]|uniref:Mitotic checkpoint regulator, MAD2B-interacting-domain-containing protein n=1 Tax=Polytolypa hystricis (strain UAMH7299) TaxID=1447883 RepID=A0A2B7Y4H5_POLH7|nr:hypothetical protein AJ80_05456 [Polytolypa hystricis UAMH7299]
MALVSYSDSEGSDSESPAVPTQKPAPPIYTSQPTKPTATTSFQPVVDRANRRKIFVNLRDSPKESATGEGEGGGEDDGPARKKPRIGAGGGGGGGAFSGFNSLLPAPKRAGLTRKAVDGASTTVRKPFGLKTGATPGFDRTADANMRRDTFGGDKDGVGDGGDGLKADDRGAEPVSEKKKEEPVVLKGNAMMFKPLSVARNGPKKKRAVIVPSAGSSEKLSQTTNPPRAETTVPAPAKKTVNLFGLSSEEKTDTLQPSLPAAATTYTPLIYNNPSESPSQGPEPEDATPEHPTSSSASTSGPQNLANIANELNLSSSEMRLLFGRNRDAAAAQFANAKVVTFNTEHEYKANADYVARMSEEELAAHSHNPVRSIAPGKHNLQQLVNAVSNQKEALEESFAAGRRNRKEAGSRYGW